MIANTGIEIFQVRDETRQRLARIADDVFDSAIAPRYLAEFCASTNHVMYCAIDGDTIVGQVRGLIVRHPDKAPEFFIENLGVTPSHQQRGIGQKLLRAALDWARRESCTGYWVATEPENTVARSLYKNITGNEQAAFIYEGAL